MKIKYTILTIAIIAILLIAFNSYPGFRVKVVDAETGEPLEGAVIMAEWTREKGIPGMSHTVSHKVFEKLTDKNGRAWISGSYNPTASLGSLVVYKKGYVAWSYDYIFPGYKKRTDFSWCCFSRIIKLERFKPEYSYIEHTSFIGSVASLSFGDKKVIYKAIRWEELESSKERDRHRKKR